MKFLIFITKWCYDGKGVIHSFLRHTHVFFYIKRNIIYSSFNLHLLNSHPLILGHSSRLCNWFVDIGSSVQPYLLVVLGLLLHVRDFVS